MAVPLLGIVNSGMPDLLGVSDLYSNSVLAVKSGRKHPKTLISYANADVT